MNSATAVEGFAPPTVRPFEADTELFDGEVKAGMRILEVNSIDARRREQKLFRKRGIIRIPCFDGREFKTYIFASAG